MNALPAVILTFLPAAAPAQDDIVFSIDQTEACLAANPGTPAICVGRSARACMEANSAGLSTFGQDACLDAELYWWDERLAAAEARTLERAKAFDTERETRANGLVVAEDTLAAETAAWAAWRDARCEVQMAQYGGGSGTSNANMRCQLELTGNRALWLEQMAEPW